MKNLIIIVALLGIGYGYFPEAKAQISEEEELTKESIYGISWNTGGGLIGGLYYKYAKRSLTKPNWFSTLSFEFVGIKHPKERNYFSQLTGNSFIFGKRNFLFSFRAQYGKEVILFKKAQRDGVRVTANLAAGPSLGILKPYYVLYQFNTNTIRSEPYDPAIHTFFPAILGTGNFFEGFDKAKYIPGVNVKLGFAMDFGAFKNAITGVEGGIVVEAFSDDILIMDGAGKDRLFSLAYLTIFFGTRK